MSSTAAAPSEICDELPAVIRPSSLKTGFNAARASSDVSGRMPWSATWVEPLTLKGTVSRSKRPSSVALAASWCERSASSSSSERGISHWSAIISAPRPWPTMLCFSMSFGVNARPNSCWVFMPAENGRWPMCSTPEPMTTS